MKLSQLQERIEQEYRFFKTGMLSDKKITPTAVYDSAKEIHLKCKIFIYIHFLDMQPSLHDGERLAELVPDEPSQNLLELLYSFIYKNADEPYTKDESKFYDYCVQAFSKFYKTTEKE